MKCVYFQFQETLNFVRELKMYVNSTDFYNNLVNELPKYFLLNVLLIYQ